MAEQARKPAALTTQTHLGITLARGDWVYAGFDLTMLGIVALLGLIAWYASLAPAGRKPVRHKAAEPWIRRQKQSGRNVLIPIRADVHRVGGAMLRNEPQWP